MPHIPNLFYLQIPFFLRISVLRHTFGKMLTRSNAVLGNRLFKSPEVKWLGHALKCVTSKAETLYSSTLPVFPIPSSGRLYCSFTNTFIFAPSEAQRE